MPIVFLLLFIGVPIVEIVIFIKAGEQIGAGATVALIVLTAILGTALLRRQGLKALERVRASLDRGEMPVDEVFTGLCLLVAGVLLLTPGFLTDAIGFTLFVPAVRRSLGAWVMRTVMTRGEVWVEGRRVDPHGSGPGTDPGPAGTQRAGPRRPRPGSPSGVIIEGDYNEIDDEEDDGRWPAGKGKRDGPDR